MLQILPAVPAALHCLQGAMTCSPDMRSHAAQVHRLLDPLKPLQQERRLLYERLSALRPATQKPLK